MKKTLYWLPLAALLMAGCSSDYTPSEQLDGPVPIHLTVSVNDLTRATTAIQSAQFGANQTFYAYFPTGVTPSTTTFETSDASGNTICTGTQPYFNQSATSASVHAYYPYVTGENGATVTNTTTSFTVQTAQNVDDNYRLSDLMYGTTASAIAKDSKSVTAALTFTHRLSKIIINATAGSGISEIQEIRIIGGYRTIAITDGTTLTLSAEASGLSDANSTTSYITMYAGGSATTANCAAIIPPQTIDGNFIQVVTDKGTATYALSSKAFAGAYQYTTNLTVNLAAINATTTITPWTVEAAESGSTTDPQTLGELTEWINYYGTLETPQPEKYSGYLGWYVKADGTISSSSTDAIGRIAYMSTSDVDTSIPGSRILVLAVSDVGKYAWKNANTSGEDSWNDESKYNGFEFTVSHNNSTTYPAAYQAYNFTTSRPSGASSWFLPSKAQWLAMLPVSSTFSLSTTGGYWTATEHSGNNLDAWDYQFATPTWSGGSKTTQHNVRACFAYPNKGIALSEVTNAHIGWVITSDGYVFNHTSAAEFAGQTPVAMIAYVGNMNNANGNGAYSESLNHGLAIALTDVSNTSGVVGSTKMYWSDAMTASSVYKIARPIASSSWMLPSAYQWERMLIACGSNATYVAYNSQTFPSSENGFGYGNFRYNLTLCGGTDVQTLGYWTSTEHSNNDEWGYTFLKSYFGHGDGSSSNGLYVRPCFAF